MIRYAAWASDPESLLRDPIGVELFWSYLEEESLGHLLKFWLAVEGLRKESDEAIIKKYVRCISKSFIRSGLIDLGEEGGVEPGSGALEAAQEAVKDKMLCLAYPNFLKSEVYLSYVRREESSCDGAPDGVDVEEEGRLLPGLPTISEEPGLKNPPNTSEGGFLSSMPKAHHRSSHANSFPYHAWGSVYNPVSRQDSELASCSTTDDNYSSFSDLSGARGVRRLRSNNHHHHSRSNHHHSHRSDLLNPREDRVATIPRRSGQVPPTPLSPQEFADALSSRLQGLLDQKMHEKKTFDLLSSKLNNIELPLGPEGGNSGGGGGGESDQSILDEHVSRIWKDKTPIVARSPGEPMRHKWASSHGAHSRTLPSSVKIGSKNSSSGHTNGAPIFESGPHTLSFSSRDCYDPRKSHHHHPHHSNSASYSSSSSGQERIAEWVKKVSCSSEYVLDEGGEPSFRHPFRGHSLKISPKSKSRKQRSGGGEWSGGAPGGSGGSNGSNTHQQLQEVNRRLLLQGGSGSVGNSSHIPGNSSSAAPGNTTTTTATTTSVTYTFSNEPEGMPYRVKIPCASSRVNLLQVKSNLPKQGNYRFYFKTRVDGEACYEEERDNGAFVPLWAQGKIIVQCRDDGL